MLFCRVCEHILGRISERTLLRQQIALAQFKRWCGRTGFHLPGRLAFYFDVRQGAGIMHSFLTYFFLPNSLL